MDEPLVPPAVPPSALDGRIDAGLRLLGTDRAGANALERADALWLARVLPESALPPPGPASFAPTAPKLGKAPAPAAKAAAPPAPSPGADRAKPVDPAPADSDVTSLFVAQPGAAGETQLNARRVQVPVADALPGRAAIERALKPFLRKRASAHRRVVDAEATAEASAQASAELLAGAGPGVRFHALVPVLRPLAERWFDVALLAEQDEAMLVFEDTLVELRNLLARHGAFGRVRLWRWAVREGAVHVQSPSGMACAPRAMLQSQRPQLVLVLTHGASSHWDGAPMRRFVRDLGARSVLAIVQMLPRRAWGFTALGEATERVRARERGAANRLLQRRDPWFGGFVDRGGLGAAPMLSLEPQALADWALFVMSPRLLEHAAVALADAEVEAAAAGVPAASAPMDAPACADAAHDDDVARTQVLRFRAIASAQAFALLRLLAGAWITLPVMRLLLNSMPGPRSAAPAAEVLLSGLLRRVSAPGAASQEMVFDFVPGVREWLHGSLSGEEQRQADAAMAESRESIRRFVEAKTGVRLASFTALLHDPRGTEFLPASARSFVDVSRRLRSLRGGVEPPLRGAGGRPAEAPATRPDDEGGLYNFPPLVEGLVPRPDLEERIAARVLALAPGRSLLLRAYPGAGGRTVLANVLRRPAVRRLFAGGIWFGTDPPAEPTRPGAPRLALRFSTKARGGDVRIELRMQRDGEVDIGYLAESEAAAQLRRMGMTPEQVERLRAVHQRVPSLVPLVGVGTALGITRWPRRASAHPEENYGALAGKVMEALEAGEYERLIAMSVRCTGLPSPQPASDDLARRLGWLCPGADGCAATLHPSVAQWMQTAYPNQARAAHLALLQSLLATLASSAPESLVRYAAMVYARDNLLHHAAAGRGTEGVKRVLFDRPLMRLLLEGDRRAMLQELTPLARKDKALAQVQRLLQSGAPNNAMVDIARRPLAPTPDWPAWLGLAEAAAPHPEVAVVRVAIVSTGMETTHPELQHLSGSGAPTDAQGHGTAVASIIAGRFIGIAPDVHLQSIVALDKQGSGSTATLLKALSQIMDAPAAERADIVCLPLGMGGVDSAAHPLVEMLRALAADGVLLVAAADNESKLGIQFPAAMPEVLSVGATTAAGEPAPFSSRGPVRWAGGPERDGPDLWAPGVDITVATPLQGSGEPRDAVLPQARYGTQSGTSFSCAIVVGIAALYLRSTGLRGPALRSLLMQTAEGGRVRYDPRAGHPSARDAPPSETSAQQERMTQAVVSAVSGNDVVAVRLASGPTLNLHPSTAGEILQGAPAPNENADAADPTGTPQPALSKWAAIAGIDVLKNLHKDPAASLATSRVVHRVDTQVDPGVYALQRDALMPLKGGGRLLTQLPPRSDGGVALVFVHGTFVDTATTFGKLWSSHRRKVDELFDAYDGHVYALDHATLGESVIGNALQLVRALPSGARLHLATHSRGGLVAEVLARVAAQARVRPDDLTHFAGDAYTHHRAELRDLAHLVHQKGIEVERIVRVACPARGIPIAGGRLDAYLSVFKWALELSHTEVNPPLVDFMMEAARRRADPMELPGLECMAPDRPVLRWLYAAEEPIPGELRVLAGESKSEGVGSWVKTLLTDAAYWSDSDLVVSTRSMYGGVLRRDGALFWRDAGAEVGHFSYFANERSARAFVDALLHDRPAGFAPIGPMSWSGQDASGVR